MTIDVLPLVAPVDKIRCLPVHPVQFDGESFLSWMLRVSGVYEMRPAQLLASVGLQPAGAMKHDFVPPLEWWSVLRAALSAGSKAEWESAPHDVVGGLPAKVPSICLECVASVRCRKTTWSAVETTFCPEHQQVLIDICPHCRVPTNLPPALSPVGVVSVAHCTSCKRPFEERRARNWPVTRSMGKPFRALPSWSEKREVIFVLVHRLCRDPERLGRICLEAQMPLPERSTKPFETRAVRERHLIVAAASLIMQQEEKTTSPPMSRISGNSGS